MSPHPTAAILSACTCGSFRTCEARTHTGHHPRPIAHLSLTYLHISPTDTTLPHEQKSAQRRASALRNAFCSTAALHKRHSPASMIETWLRTVDSAPSSRLRSRGRSLL